MELYLETDRLVIKDLGESDAAAMYAYRIMPSVRAYQGFSPKNVGDVVSFIRDNAGRFNKENDWFQVGIYHSDALIGDMGIHFIGPQNLQCEIGYTIDPAYQRKGFGKEALASLVTYLFETMHKHRIVTSLDPGNIASIALLEKLGFRKEGLFKESLLVEGEWVDDLVYAMLKDEWRS